MGTPTRFTFGLTTTAKETALGMFGMPDPTKWHVYFNDFDTFATADWTITTVEGGTGDATEALADADGGVLVVTNDNADNDSDFFQKVGESFLLASGKKCFFKMRFKTDAAVELDWYCGLMITDTDPLSSTAGDGVTDGIFFMKDDGDANVDFYVQKNATTGQLTTTAVTTQTADTYMSLAFYFDGKRFVRLYKDDLHIDTVDLTTTLTTYLPDTELTISFGIKNGEAAATKAMSIDYIFVANER